jgi:signal transduction histidine kinase
MAPLPTIHVLIVEDNPGDAELLTLMLAESTRQKFRVSRATTLANGFEHLRSGARTDVVLLDLTLPDASGEATVIRMRETAPNLPIVIMTGFDDAEFAEQMVVLGAQDYLVKGDSSSPMVWRTIRYAITRMQHDIERESLVKELRASGEMKNKMFGILAHDLRNPIGIISGYAEFIEMMEADNLSERTKGSLTAIRESATFMNDLIKDVLAMAVSEADEISVARQMTDIGAMVRKTVSFAAMAAGKKQVRLAIDAGTVWIEADTLKIEQVLNNLISNAIKFSNEGAIVTVRAFTGDGDVSISVTDHGTGIPPHLMDDLFKPFVKGKTGTAGERSNGLGLYICSQIVKAHGGRIEIATKEGDGATFTVILPCPSTSL